MQDNRKLILIFYTITSNFSTTKFNVIKIILTYIGPDRFYLL